MVAGVVATHVMVLLVVLNPIQRISPVIFITEFQMIFVPVNDHEAISVVPL